MEEINSKDSDNQMMNLSKNQKQRQLREDIESNLDDHKYSLLAATANAGTIDEYNFYEEDYPNSENNSDNDSNNNEDKDERLIIVRNEYQQIKRSKDNSLDYDSITSLSKE